MALFPDTKPDYPATVRRSHTIGWFLVAFGLLATLLLALLPAPYVIEKPGPVYDTLDEVETADGDVPLIEIEGEQTYPARGSLNLLTVTITGNPANLPTWGDVLAAWLDPVQTVIPVESLYPPGLSPEESAEQSRVDMLNSQREAIAAALAELDYDFESHLIVVDTIENGPAEGVLRPDDEVVSVNGETFDDVTGLREAIAENGTDRAADVVVVRDGERLSVQLTPAPSDGSEPEPIIGILVGVEYEFPFEVTIQLENVGGPSAGLMFALGIYDKLTPGSLTGGAEFAGTGTIDAAGAVGPIGGIRQKMVGAVRSGAEWFLAPEGNCEDVVGSVPAGLEVFAVGTLHEAVEVVEAVGEGADLAGLPRCEAG